MPKRPQITDFINFNPNVGPLQCLSIGYPGSGKSSQATSIIIDCLARENEVALMHGDITCEWRHFLNYSKYLDEIFLIVPKGDGVYFTKNFTGLTGYKVSLTIYEENYETLDIVTHLKSRRLTVVYDDCFHSPSKTRLWVNIAQQLVTRSELLDHAITYLCHEAGNYYPQTAKGSQWRDVDTFCEYFVYFRKMGIRALLLTQIENEVYERLRKKCIYRIYRLCYPSDRTHARLIKKYILRMNINNYHLFFGDLYNPLCKNKATKEIRDRSMMIPTRLIDLIGSPSTSTTDQNGNETNEILQNVYDMTGSLRETAKLIGKSRDYVRKRIEVES